MATKKSSGSSLDASTQAELDAVEQELYWSHHDGSSPERKAALERHWNDLKRQEVGPSWTDKKDRRSDFQSSTRDVIGPSGRKTGELVIVEGQYHPKNQTICWRSDTKIGKKIDQKARDATKKQPGHQAGHTCPVESGIDPDQKDNLNSQHAWMNQREWREMEAAIRKHVEKSREPVNVRFVSVQPNRLGGQEAGRWVEVTDKNGQPILLPGYGYGCKNNDRLLDSQKLRYLNPPDRNAERRLQAIGPSPSPQKPVQGHLEQNPPPGPGKVIRADFAGNRTKRAEQRNTMGPKRPR